MRRWILFAKTTGSDKLKPDVSNEVSYNSQIKSFTVLSLLSASAFLTNASTIGWVGLTSIVFLELMYVELELSRKAWDFMMRSIFADQPYSPVTRQQGESANLFDTTTFSTFVSRMSLICLHSPSVAALASSKSFFSSSVSSSVRPSLVAQISFLSSNSLSCWTQYSSMGSTRKRTSYPRFFNCSINGEFSTAERDSPVT